jgi:hypothetical protein
VIPIPPPNEPLVVDGESRTNDVWYRYLDSLNLTAIQVRGVGPLADNEDALAFDGGDYGTLVQIKNEGTTASALFFVYSGNTITMIAGDTSWEASTTPAGGNSGLGWGGSNYRIYNNTGVTRTYSVLAHIVSK